MATKKLTALQIFKETKRLDAIESKARKDRAALRAKLKAQTTIHNDEKLVVNGFIYELNTYEDGEIYIIQLGTVEEFSKIL